VSAGSARGSNGPMECAEGDVRVTTLSNGGHNMGALQDKIPLGAAEPTRAAGDFVSLGDRYVTKRRGTEVGGCVECRIEAVPISRSKMTRSAATVWEVNKVTWVIENCPRCVPVPTPVVVMVAGTTEVLTASCPLKTPIKGTCTCAAAGMASAAAAIIAIGR